jgi:hypothetical protein
MGRDLDVATNAAKELLTSIYPDWNNPRAYWELEKYDFPPNESEPPKGEKYSAYAEYFHVGSTSACDSGMSDTVIKLTDAEAVKFYKDLYGRETFYQLKVTVYKGDKVVEKFKAGPQPEDFYQSGFEDGYMEVDINGGIRRGISPKRIRKPKS